MTRLEVAIERFPIAGSFTISRGSKTEAVVVVATIRDGPHVGQGECVPYARYGETPEAVAAAIQSLSGPIADGATNGDLQHLLPPGAARNALDCALIDLAAKRSGRPAHELLGLRAPRTVVTCVTISLGTPEAMAEAAIARMGWPLLKLKLGGAGDRERIAAVREAVPSARLVVDANEAWDEASLEDHLAACAGAGVELVEQPLPAGRDLPLAEIARPVPVCADESIHGLASLPDVLGRYDAINIKLDKTGGLTEALALAAAARSHGLGLMIGSMVATSLSVAPALLLAADCDFADLDGPVLLQRDRSVCVAYDGANLLAPTSGWGWPT